MMFIVFNFHLLVPVLGNEKGILLLTLLDAIFNSLSNYGCPCAVRMNVVRY